MLVVDPRMAGISGDMLVSALADLTGMEDAIRKVAEVVSGTLDRVERLEVEFRDVRRGGLRGRRMMVNLVERPGSMMASDALEQVEKMCRELDLGERASNLVRSVFRELADAEISVHGYEPEKAHFHELGSADTFLDVLGVAYLLQRSGLIEEPVHTTPPALGGGHVRISHGYLPVPAPAVLEILRRHGYRISSVPVEAELTTPTGAALLVNLASKVVDTLPPMRIDGIGVGAGERELEGVPNLLRIVRGGESGRAEVVALLETNVDDVSGEVLGHLIGRMMELGALDVSVIPIMGKKGRPAHLIRVISKPWMAEELANLLMMETGSLGVRLMNVPRVVAEREIRTIRVELAGGEFEVRVKVSRVGDRIVGVKPEHDDLKRISARTGLPLRRVEELVRSRLPPVD